MNIKNYLKLIGIDIEIDNIDELVEFLDNNKLNYWNYCINRNSNSTNNNIDNTYDYILFRSSYLSTNS